jgi:two-component system cell cycle sensor histidine kinase/response regulator CckA
VSFDPAAGRVTLESFKARQPYRDFIYERRLASGKVVYINSSGTPRFGKDGSFLGYHGVARDVTAQVEAERRQWEIGRRYRRIFETGSDTYWEQDKHARITYLSSTFERSTGIPVAELMGRRLSDLPNVAIDPESGARTLAAIKARQPYSDLLHTITRKDGRVIHVGTSGIPMFDESGEFTGYCGVSKDITAQVEAERALRQSEARFRELFEIAGDHYWETDAQGRITYISPNYESITGISATEIVGRRLDENPRVSISPEMGRKALIAMRDRQPYRDFVYSYQFPDGRKRWISLDAVPVIAADGTYQGLRGVGSDVTQRVDAEHAARLAQQRLEDAFSYVTQPIVVYNGDNRVVAFNQAFTELHRVPKMNTPVHAGVSFDELVEWQQNVGFFAKGADDAPVTPIALLEVFRSGQEHTYHLWDGRWMLVIYRRLPAEGRVGLWTDVTAIKQAEAERRALEAQLHHSQRLEALGTLAGGAAHEINNALVPVIGLAKLMASKQPEGSRERRNLDLILGGAERSRDLVKQILAFSRKEEEQRARASTDITVVLREALRMMRATVPTSIRVVEDISQTPPIDADPGQLQQVIVNMVTNAAQAIGQASGTIRVALGPDGDGANLRLSIADTGCGMDETTRTRVFEPFFTTKPVGEGTGLGLSVAHGIIKAHGGRIEVTSTRGQGTRFDIVLPVIGVPALPAETAPDFAAKVAVGLR